MSILIWNFSHVWGIEILHANIVVCHLLYLLAEKIGWVCQESILAVFFLMTSQFWKAVLRTGRLLLDLLTSREMEAPCP